MIVTSAVDDDKIMLLDASAIAADTDTINLKTSSQADVEMLFGEIHGGHCSPGLWRAGTPPAVPL